MKKIYEEKIKKKLTSREWKEKNIEYINALNRFFDTVDNVQDEKLKMDIIYNMLRCDEILTNLAEKNLSNEE